MLEVCNAQYKNKQGIKITTSKLESIILPAEGGKMVSLKERGADSRELLAQAEGEIYKDLTFNSGYVESECSGFDEMFPTIDPWYNAEREYADHGEVCRLPNAYTISKDKVGVSLKLSVLSPFEDYIFSKIYKESKDGGITIEYEVQNPKDKPLKAIWASHFMLQAEEGTEVRLADNRVYEVEFMFSEHADVAQRGTVTQIKNGCELLRSVHKSESANAYKFYIKEPYTDDFRYGKIKIKCENVKYLGIWINNGCFKGMYNVAAEFCTGAYDTPGAAEANGADVTIPAGGTLKWKLFISVQ